MSAMIRLGPDVSRFDASVSALIKAAQVSLPPETVYEIRYAQSEDRNHNDLQWHSDAQMQKKALFARLPRESAISATFTDPKGNEQIIPRVQMIARMKTGAV